MRQAQLQLADLKTMISHSEVQAADLGSRLDEKEAELETKVIELEEVKVNLMKELEHHNREKIMLR